MNYSLVERLLQLSQLHYLAYLRAKPDLAKEFLTHLLPLLPLSRRPDIVLQALEALSRLISFLMTSVQSMVPKIQPLVSYE